MYARDYAQTPVSQKDFEDARARQELLRGNGHHTQTGSDNVTPPDTAVKKEDRVLPEPTKYGALDPLMPLIAYCLLEKDLIDILPLLLLLYFA